MGQYCSVFAKINVNSDSSTKGHIAMHMHFEVKP